MRKLLIISLIIFFGTGTLAGANWFLQNSFGEELRVKLSNVKNYEQTEYIYDRVQTSWDESSGDRERVSKLILSDEKDTIEFLSELDRLAVANLVTISTNDLKEETIKNSKFNELVATFVVSGNDYSVKQTVRGIELLPYNLGVDRLVITRSGAITVATITLRLSILK